MAEQPGWSVYHNRQVLPWMTPWTTGRFYQASIGAGSTTLAIPSQMMAAPVYVPNTNGVTITSIGIEVTTGGAAGSVVRLGIYTDVQGYPGQLLLDAGTLAADAIAYVSASISLFLWPGWYWLATAGNGGTARAINAGLYEVLGAFLRTDNGGPYGAFQVTTASDAATQGLPATFPVSGGGAASFKNTSPRVLLGV